MTPEQLRQACEAAGLISEPSEIQDLWRLPPITENDGHYLYDDHVALLPTVAALLRDRCVREGRELYIYASPRGDTVSVEGSFPEGSNTPGAVDELTITACMQALGLWEVET